MGDKKSLLPAELLPWRRELNWGARRLHRRLPQLPRELVRVHLIRLFRELSPCERGDLNTIAERVDALAEALEPTL
ncbi:MAG: hypothetical protein DRP74_07300 [Candidatus Omnitrophota bacterium]|nr:MAG: hypothetical protein DRP74_07300 [Candidatus Omnitrophota bacterium]